MIKRVRVSSDLEKKIVIACITNDNFLQQMMKVIKVHLLKVEYSKIIVQWCFNYFNDFKKAPGRTIEEIYYANKDTLDPSVAKIVSNFLEVLSKEYSEGQKLNIPYLMKRARDYMDILIHEDLFEKGKGLLAQNKLNKVKKLIREYQSVAKDVEDSFNPFDSVEIQTFFQDDEEFNLFSFDGALNDIVGPLKRGWFLGIMAPMKRGKSYWLMEILFQAFMSFLKVVYISFEMTKQDLKERFYVRGTGYPLEPLTVIYPILDCKMNQIGLCKKKAKYLPERADEPCLIEDEEKGKPSFKEADPKYKPCTYCRENNLRGFVPEYWFVEKVYNKCLSKKLIENKFRNFKKRMKDCVRFKVYPSNMASMSDILEYLDGLEFNEGFIPDVIITDYADLMKPDYDLIGDEERSAINNIWRAHKKVAQLKNCLVCTVTQSNRKSIDAENVRAVDSAEDIRKMAHVNIMLSLSQMEEEKENGVMRVGIAEHRHKKFIESKQVTVLECRELGQACLFSEWIDRDNSKKTKKGKSSKKRSLI